MFNPQYQVVLTKKCFYSDNAVCLGTQLILIINTLKEFLAEHTWYGADIEATGKNANKFNTNNFTLKQIGNDLQINQYCLEIDQFISGVFLCVSDEFLLQNIKNIELGTEDEEFRAIDCNGILIEIRTFDTSFFEIYSENLEIIYKLSKKFNVEEAENKNRL